MAVGAIMWMKHISFGSVKPRRLRLWRALLGLLYVLYSWWSDVIEEAVHGGFHTRVVQISHRYGMILFIMSEVMFFVAWFWAFFDASLFSGAASEFDRAHSPAESGGMEVLDPWHFTLLNTLVLLTSGTTVTWAHHALLQNDRFGLKAGLILTILRPTNMCMRPSHSKAQSTTQPFSWRPASMGFTSLLEQFSSLFASLARSPVILRASSMEVSNSPPDIGILSTWSGCSYLPAFMSGHLGELRL